mgnify:CR=1 FL=1
MSGWSESKNHTLGLLISRGNVSGGTILRRIFTEVDRQLPIPVARSPNGVRPQGASPLQSTPATVVSKLNSPSHRKISRLPKLRTMSDTTLWERVHALKRKSKLGGMTELQYRHVFSYVRDNAPQRLLVWGLGFDSQLYAQLNSGGETLFLEGFMNDFNWAAKTQDKFRAAFAGLNVSLFNASALEATAGTWRRFVQQPFRAPDRLLPILSGRHRLQVHIQCAHVLEALNTGHIWAWLGAIPDARPHRNHTDGPAWPAS